MELVRNRTIPIVLPNGKNTLADTMFEISIGHTNLGNANADLVAESAFLVTFSTNMAGYPTQNNVFIGKI